MAHQVIVVSKPPAHRRLRRVGEVAGGGAADCAAVCCCCPCAVLNLVVLAVYKVPAGLFRKAMRKRQRRSLAANKKNNVVLLQPQRSSGVDLAEALPVSAGPKVLEDRLEAEGAAEKPEAVALEKEMWARFAGTGFWRSESQRHP